MMNYVHILMNLGFLCGFNDVITYHLATVKNITELCGNDKNELGKNYEQTLDKVFLPSYTEITGNKNDAIEQGKHFSYFNSKEKLIKTLNNVPAYYWMRSTFPWSTNQASLIYTDGYSGGYDSAYNSPYCIAPVIVLK